MTRILVLTLALLACIASAQGQGYYPSASGLSWTYNSGETQVLTGPREFAGSQVMVLTHYFEGQPVSEDYLIFDDGVRSVGTAANGGQLEYVPPLQVYAPEPLEVGDTWQSRTSVSGIDIQLSAEVMAVRGVQTPAGRFNALQIRQVTVTSSGAQTVLDLYFVPGVGVVRFVTQDGTSIDLIEKNF